MSTGFIPVRHLLCYDAAGCFQGLRPGVSIQSRTDGNVFDTRRPQAKNKLFTAVIHDHRLSRKIWQNISLCGEIIKLCTLIEDPCRISFGSFGVGRSVIENGELYGPRFLRPPRLATSCSAASARRPAGGTASVTGQTCSALHSALPMDSVMETELTARPNTNSGLHYMPNYM